tara:strand:- start:151 stop:303 length:153 start_codon:yes stop_codon:yes gene_type:complete
MLPDLVISAGLPLYLDAKPKADPRSLRFSTWVRVGVRVGIRIRVRVRGEG